MKKLIVVLLITVIVLLAGSFSAFTQAQSSASQLKPTFLAPTPGTYVHGWPAFTVSYPKDWVEQPPSRYGGRGEVFRVVAPDSKPFAQNVRVPYFAVLVFPTPLPIDKWSNILLPTIQLPGSDIKIVYDKPSQLKAGVPAQEAEIAWVSNEEKVNMLVLTMRKDAAWIQVIQVFDKGKKGEDVKNYAYSLTFQQGREEPVKVPSDVQEFLDKYSSDLVSGNVERIMANFSDRFLNQRRKKAFYEQWVRNSPESPIQRGLISSEATVTVFEAQGDKAYVDGFFASKARDHADKALNESIGFRQIIKEQGQWKWYGDQR
ncbi:MAG: hypothetical protein A2Z43_04605 [Syntrophobacterales bacterium RBG_19FT_COMBO_59_10]|nr:MAG: hypothetical protein A2Z43_04605 [Syntrophobacterales bacterium RBG_19FT_COMBO_59_10]